MSEPRIPWSISSCILRFCRTCLSIVLVTTANLLCLAIAPLMLHRLLLSVATFSTATATAFAAALAAAVLNHACDRDS